MIEMEDCKTPTFQEIGFRFNMTPTLVTDMNCLQDVHNLRVDKLNVRCFTPTLDDFRSPGLSPIEALKKKALAHCTKKMDQCFQQHNLKEFMSRYQPSPTGPAQSDLSQKQKGGTTPEFSPQMIFNKIVDENNGPFELSLKSLSPCESGNSDLSSSSLLADITRNSDSQFLNHTLNVISLLRNAGLKKYAGMFLKEGFDLDKFLNIKQIDLHKMGIKSEEHREIILKLVRDLNTP